MKRTCRDPVLVANDFALRFAGLRDGDPAALGLAAMEETSIEKPAVVKVAEEIRQQMSAMRVTMLACAFEGDRILASTHYHS